jgi:hypothetical protein
MNYRVLYKKADTQKKLDASSAFAVGQPQIFDPSQTGTPRVQPKFNMRFPSGDDLENPTSEHNEVLRQNRDAVSDAENGQRVGENYELGDIGPLRNYSPAFQRGFIEARKKALKSHRAIADLGEQTANYAILPVAGLGKGAEKILQLPYHLINYGAGAAADAGLPGLFLMPHKLLTHDGSKNPLPDPGSFFTPAIVDARKSVVRNGGSADAADAITATAEAVPEMLAYNYAMGKAITPLMSIPGRTGTAVRTGVELAPVVTPTAEEGAKAVTNTDTVRYSLPGIMLGRIPAMQDEYNRLVASGMSPEEALRNVNQRRISDIIATAQRKYPDDEQAQHKFIVDNFKTFTRLGTPGWSEYDLTNAGIAPEEAAQASAQGALTEETNRTMDNSVLGKIPGVSQAVAFYRSFDPTNHGAALARGKGYMNVVPAAVQGLHTMLSDDKANPVDSKNQKFMKGYLEEVYKDPKKKEAFLSALASGVADKYDLDSMKTLAARVQKMGKDMNWEEYGLTKEQGAEFMQAMETGFKNRACALWKEDIIGNTPKLVSLWLRNMGVSDAIADVVENPWAFYAGAFGLLLGGGALIGSMFSGDDSPAPRQTMQPQVVRSPYDEGYTQFAPVRLG